MKTFVIDVYELHHSLYTIEARDRGEAIAKFFDGEGSQVDDSQEYIEGADRYGKTPQEMGFTNAEIKSLKERAVNPNEALSGIRGIEIEDGAEDTDPARLGLTDDRDDENPAQPD